MALNYLILVILGTVWGSSFIFIKMALEGFDPPTLTALRIVLGALFLMAVGALMRHGLPRAGRIWFWLGVAAVAGNAVPFTLMNFGQQHIDTSVSAILITTVPIFTLILAHFLTDDRFTWRKLVGVVMGFAGVLLLLGPQALDGLSAAFFGQAMIVAASACFAINLVLSRRYLTGLQPTVTSGYSLGLGALMTVPAAFVFGAPAASSMTPTATAGLLLLAIIATGTNILLLYVLLRRAGPNFVAMNNYVAPVAGIALGALVWGEPVTWLKIAATLIILAGIAIATWRSGALAPARFPAGQAPR